MNENDLRAAGYVEGVFGWYKPKNIPVDSRKPAVVELTVGPGVEEKHGDQEKHSGKVLIRIEDVRRRLLDSDNLVAKFHVDCLRYAKIICGDAPGQASIQVSQRKLREGEFPHTNITIERL
jgi:hypothetical protein